MHGFERHSCAFRIKCYTSNYNHTDGKRNVAKYLSRDLAIDKETAHCEVIADEDVVFPKCGEYLVRGRITMKVNTEDDVVFIADRFRLSKRNILAADVLYAGLHLVNNVVMVRVINPMVCGNVLYKGTKMGRFQVVPKIQEINVLDNVQMKENNEVVKEILDRHIHLIGKNEYEKLKTILFYFKSIFSRASTDVGQIKDCQHEIDTGNHPPIALNPRRIPMHVETKVDRLISDLQKKKVVTKISSPWNFPIVVVPKKNGDIRLCIDYRKLKLNAVTERPVYYIPDSKQLFDCLEGSKYFSSLDLSMGYHQVEMDKEDIQKTAFTTRTGQYAFLRMPFGLCGAPQTFQRVMASIVREQNWKHRVIYLDDVLLFGKSLAEHNERLRSVWGCLAEAGVKLSPNKCSFMKTKTVYLGHVIDTNGPE